MSALKAEKVRFAQLLAEKQRTDMDAVRRAWRQKMDEFDRAKSSVDVGYDGLQARLETVFTALQVKTVQLSDRRKELQSSIDALRRHLSRALAAAEIRGSDESAEIQVELRLKMQAGDLNARIVQSQAEYAQVQEHGAKYKALYLKNIAKQRRIQSAAQAAQRMKDIEAERVAGMSVLKQRVKEEHERLAQDIETVRKMREDLLHPPPPPTPKKPARELYREMLKEAGQLWDKDDPQFSRCRDSDSALVFEDSKSGGAEPAQTGENEQDTGQVAFLENSVRALLGTGNYAEDDPIIRRLRSQIADITARRS
jgi:hypothetical protein